MGVFYYSKTKKKPKISDFDQNIRNFSSELFGPVKIEQVIGIPISNEDDRIGKWDIEDSYSVVLLKDGTMEFKVPGSMFDDRYERQQRLRRKLVRFYNKI